jgi:L-alanine-DL-glutamate epimerase-like enolase superfamily enzyme
MVDAGWAWGRDVEVVCDRARRFEPYRVTWLEEPLLPDAIAEYGELSRRKPPIPIAAGENAATMRAAEAYIEQGGLAFIQIDTGRIGGITTARKVAERAAAKGITYVNHTFKSRLSVAASLHVFADFEQFPHLEYPTARSPLSEELVTGALDRDAEGRVTLTEAPGLGVTVNRDCLRKYAAPVRIDIAGRTIFQTADL